MPTQSSGGLTKRSNEDISALDVFEGEGTVVTAYSESGFVINEEYTEGSILTFPKKFWSWKASSMDDITIANLAPIWLHNPVPRTPQSQFLTTFLNSPSKIDRIIFCRDPSPWHWNHVGATAT